MALLGQAALAMWWDMAPAMLADFEHWHTHKHYPERLGIPDFRRASQWRDANGGEGIFQLYELDDHDVLSSTAYLARLNAPTPWSTRMMSHHRNMVRSQCKLLASHGGVAAAHALTVRLSPAHETANEARACDNGCRLFWRTWPIAPASAARICCGTAPRRSLPPPSRHCGAVIRSPTGCLSLPPTSARPSKACSNTNSAHRGLKPQVRPRKRCSATTAVIFGHAG